MQEDLSWPNFRAIDENARASLRAGSPDGFVIFSEHLARIHFPNPRFQTQQQVWIQQKYANFRLDLVIAVGGYVTRFTEMGKQAGETGLRMLAGEHPKDAFARSDYLFDARQLRRWKIPESTLPVGSIVLNRQPSIWETYRYFLFAAILLSLLETLLILALLWQRVNRKRAEQTLRESEERFRLVANSAPTLIWMAGTDKRCIFFNQGWLDFTGRSMEQELGDGWVSGVHPEDVQRCLEFYSDSFDARAQFEMEYRLRRSDGDYRWIVDRGVPRFESDDTFCGYIGSCIDITDRKLSEESLHALSGRLINAQEQERARIARELHDDFSQRLALLGIGLGQLWKNLPQSDVQAHSKVLEMLKGIKEMSSDLHTLSHQLHSSKLEHVGLVAALNGLCNEISEKYDIPVQFTAPGARLTLPKDVALCLFRVAQEALANVAKHSGTKSAQVDLSAMEDGITLRISDQGSGFDPDLGSSGAGIGLIGMSERLRLIGGRLSINSQFSQGTEIIAEAPLPIAAKETELKAQSAGG